MTIVFVALWSLLPPKARVASRSPGLRYATRMARPPYHIARQEHLGDMLDELQTRGCLKWKWGYQASRAVFHIALEDGEFRELDTRGAEELVQRECNALGIRWCPVRHPGGERQRAEAVAWIEAEH
jgi:hypothetical protein